MSVYLFFGICCIVGQSLSCLIPAGSACQVWPWTFGSRTAFLVNKSAVQPSFTLNTHFEQISNVLAQFDTFYFGVFVKVQG